MFGLAAARKLVAVRHLLVHPVSRPLQSDVYLQSISLLNMSYVTRAQLRERQSKRGESDYNIVAGQKRTLECRWQDFFSDPSQWWDHRSDKTTARYPDFRHKKTQEGLWIGGRFNPDWVDAKLAAMEPTAVHRNPFSWNIKLAKYVKDGQDQKALELFKEMQQEGMTPDIYTFIPVLNACARLGALEEGKCIHTQIIQSNCELDAFVGISLLHMYAKCGSIEDAWTVFSKMPKHKVVSWNAMIRGYVKGGHGQKALELYRQMEGQQVKPDAFTFVAVLNACASVTALEEGKHVHAQIIESGLEAKISVGNSLMDMYAKCGSIEDAWRVFNKIPKRDVVSFNTMITGYVKCGQGQKALELFRQMQGEQVKPDPVTFVGILNTCASVGALEEGRGIHAQIVQSNCESDLFVGSSLIDMYAKCGSIDDAWLVFNKMPTHTVVSWNAMIAGYVKCLQAQKGLELFQQMQVQRVKPDPVTFVGVLNACASVGAIEQGRLVHDQVIRSNCEANVFVRNSLVDMYAKCGSIDDAWEVFSKMPTCTVISWNTMIGGYLKWGQGQKALELYKQMKKEQVEPNGVTLVQVLNACTSIQALEEGKHIHAQVIKSGWEGEVFVGSSLVDMYAKWEHR